MAKEPTKQEDGKQEEGMDTPVQEGDTNDSGNLGEQGAASPSNTEEAKPEAKATSKAKTIRFALSDKQLMWSTPSKSIELSAFTQTTGSEIRIDDEDYPRVKRAINLEVLVQLKPEAAFPVFKSKELTYSKVDKDAKVTKAYDTDDILNLRQEEAVAKLAELSDARIIIKIIQAEKKGKNKEKVARQVVLSALRAKLRKLNVNGVYDIELDDL